MAIYVLTLPWTKRDVKSKREYVDKILCSGSVMGMGGVWTFRHWSQEIHSATCVISGSSFHHSRKRISFDVPGRKQLTYCPTIHGCSCTDGGGLTQVHCPWQLWIPSHKQDGCRMCTRYRVICPIASMGWPIIMWWSFGRQIYLWKLEFSSTRSITSVGGSR